MEIILVIILLIVVSAVSGAAQKAELERLKGLQKAVVKDIAKVCPPHKWFYQEIKDLEGETRSWRIVCELCGPMRPMDGERK